LNDISSQGLPMLAIGEDDDEEAGDAYAGWALALGAIAVIVAAVPAMTKHRVSAVIADARGIVCPLALSL
jgi:hypothetical protein